MNGWVGGQEGASQELRVDRQARDRQAYHGEQPISQQSTQYRSHFNFFSLRYVLNIDNRALGFEFIFQFIMIVFIDINVGSLQVLFNLVDEA